MRFLTALLILTGIFFQPTASSAVEGQLSHETLKSLLIGLGYDPVEKTFSNTKESFWQIPIRRGRWTFNVGVEVSDPDIVYSQISFGLYEGDAQNIPHSVLLGMIVENAQLKWARFQYFPQTKKFYLASRLRNLNVSPADLRHVIDELVVASDRTQKLWDPGQWPKATDVADKDAKQNK